MSRPLLHVTNAASRKLHGPGARYNIMARPRHFEIGDGYVRLLAPRAEDLDLVRRGAIPRDVYFMRCLDLWREAEARGAFRPGNLLAETACGEVAVGDGDTLWCACSVQAATDRECHRWWASPFLLRAGWNVRLDGMLRSLPATPESGG